MVGNGGGMQARVRAIGRDGAVGAVTVDNVRLSATGRLETEA
jgi:hypothetical protein